MKMFMIDLICIFSKTGILLWQKSFIAKPTDLINRLIKEVIIPESASQTTTIEKYQTYWTFENEFGYIVALFHSRMIQLSYTKELLLSVSNRFKLQYQKDEFEFPSFDSAYHQILDQFEGKETKNVPRSFEESKKYQNTLQGSNTAPVPTKPNSPRPFQPKKGQKQGKKGKELRSWDGSGAATTHSGGVLDYSQGNSDQVNVSAELLGDGMGKIQKDGTYTTLELEQIEKPSSMFSFFSSLTVGTPLTMKELDKPMDKMKEHLVQKNVSAPVAAHICETVSNALVGKKMTSLQSIDSTIKQEMELALSKIMTPGSSIDILADIANRKKGVPYTIVFVGVNGVGKSTNLSKICFWLLQNRLSVLIAACDTFRSGAVEQLRVHVRNLGALKEGSRVELFDKGYGKDPAGIAKEACGYAKNEGFDVVLIDTAGRMQDNEPLMRALAKVFLID
jgi:signal recognition particle receptor subunit alpha